MYSILKGSQVLELNNSFESLRAKLFRSYTGNPEFVTEFFCPKSFTEYNFLQEVIPSS